ncbi:hypothetical protein FIV00_03510 [Labrenzia sp. THAF82]|uniref:hypothetical protein n=1 Tax=Labrenzia sp. THAF82 TaxID=2587861 RepID=UPI001267EDDA|nr:hypothetical protein [Labrenzia sp. THAF82]QFT29536.1 hypothetical protein FIV00_03510 [Labrenzia sp. THAF82]
MKVDRLSQQLQTSPSPQIVKDTTAGVFPTGTVQIKVNLFSRGVNCGATFAGNLTQNNRAKPDELRASNKAVITRAPTTLYQDAKDAAALKSTRTLHMRLCRALPNVNEQRLLGAAQKKGLDADAFISLSRMLPNKKISILAKVAAIPDFNIDRFMQLRSALPGERSKTLGKIASIKGLDVDKLIELRSKLPTENIYDLARLAAMPDVNDVIQEVNFAKVPLLREAAPEQPLDILLSYSSFQCVDYRKLKKLRQKDKTVEFVVHLVEAMQPQKTSELKSNTLEQGLSTIPPNYARVWKNKARVINFRQIISGEAHGKNRRPGTLPRTIQELDLKQESHGAHKKYL